jgi:DNA repair exonuclease SbcCD ATPase subunit
MFFRLMLSGLVFVAALAPTAPGADEKKDKELDGLAQKLQALEKQATEARKLREKLETDLASGQQRFQKAQEEHREASKTLEKAQEQYREALKAFEKSDADKAALEKKVKAIQLEIEARAKKVADLLAENQKLKEEAKKLEEDYRTAAKKNEKLMEEYRELLKTLDSYKAANPNGRAGLVRNPPKEDVKGKVTAFDAETGQVTISIGKDAGLEKDHTLEVYRLKPKPLYVGILRITEVKKNEAIGKMTLRRGTPAVDDEVASEILSK